MNCSWKSKGKIAVIQCKPVHFQIAGVTYLETHLGIRSVQLKQVKVIM